MRVAFVSTILDYPWGGADFLWTRAAEAAADGENTLLLVVSAKVARHPRVAALEGPRASFLLREQEAAPLSLGARLLSRIRPWLRVADPVVAALERFRPDLVVISCGAAYDLGYLPAWTGWLIASGVRFRLVANWQMERPWLGDPELERVLRLFAAAESLYFVSTRNLTATRRHLGAALSQARVIHNPLRWKEADVTPWPSAPQWNLATVSRLDSGKGIALFLRAAAGVLPRGGEWQINIHGIGPEERALQVLAQELGITARVRFHGYVPDLRAIWGVNHLMVSPAIEDGVPMTIPEALLCERPVLATAVGGAEDWIDDGRSGFLSPEPTVEALQRTLSNAWGSRSRWERMGKSGAVETISRYRPDDYLQLIR